MPVKCENNPPKRESLLWQHLRKKPAPRPEVSAAGTHWALHRRFHICFDPMLAIEIDGSQHTGLIAYDAERSAFLECKGFKVIRFWNREVLAQTDRVREAIKGNASRN